MFLSATRTTRSLRKGSGVAFIPAAFLNSGSRRFARNRSMVAARSAAGLAPRRTACVLR